MTEESSVQQSTMPETLSPVAPVNESNTHTPPAETESYVPQEKVNNIAGAARKSGYDSGYEKGIRDAEGRTPAPQQNFQQQPQQAPAQPNGYSEEAGRQDAARYVREEYESHQRQLQDQQKQKEENDLVNRFKQVDQTLLDLKKDPKVLERYPDFAEKLDKANNFSDSVMARVKYGTSFFENGTDMIYALADSPMADEIAKAATDERLMMYLQRFSDDLKSNRAAQNSQSPQRPLSDVNASTGLNNNGNGKGNSQASWSDFENDKRLMS